MHLLIIGAGPYGLAMAALAKHHGMDVAILGRPFELWRRHMPPGMLLRSDRRWQIDPLEIHTLERYLRDKDPDRAEPLSRDGFLGYLEWFVQEKGITIVPELVRSLRREGDGFVATLGNGLTMTANLVLAASGIAPFAHRPPELVDMFPPERVCHTYEDVDFRRLRGRRCLIVGGRQSAFEWAALIAEAGARAVHVAYRHPTPELTRSDWSWVKPYVDLTVSNPRWFRDLGKDQRMELESRFWREGRLKLEPWLAGRIRRPEIHLHPETRIQGCRPLADGTLRIALGSGEPLAVEHVILATGYKMDLRKMAYLEDLGGIETENGYPRLDEHFQSSVPGLFFAGFPTTASFGPFFGFLVGAPVTAKVIAKHLLT